MSTLFQFLLILAALGLGFFGFVSLSEATFGVGLIGLACVCGILARISQAAAHQRTVETRLAELTNETAKTVRRD